MKSVRHFRGGAALLTAAVLALSGCYSQVSTTKPSGTPRGTKGHDHPDEGPHGGTLAEWGNEEYHAEFTVDHDKKQATVYVLDGMAKKAVPIQAESITLTLTNVKPPAQVTLKADPQKDDPKGLSSRFVGQHDALAKEMEFDGEISGKVGDKAYTGDFKEKAHKDHKHDKK